MPTIAQALAAAAERLGETSDSPRLDAEVLLCHVLERDRSHLFAWPERALEPSTAATFEGLVDRRAAGEPVAHLTGWREFWSLALRVTPDTLIPRPETELLVELALERLPGGAALRVADLGTGSGAVALAIASERPACRVCATDASAAALAVARDNAARLGLTRIEFRQGPWFEPLADERFALIASNPPYIASGDPHLGEGDVRFEPRRALAAGDDGLDDIRAIVAAAPGHLLPGGWLLLEHGYNQGEAVEALLRQAGFGAIECRQDEGGRERVTFGQLGG